MIIICKICENGIDEEKLSQHSLKCKEVALLREEIHEIRLKMDVYAKSAHRMKVALESQATKQRNLQRKGTCPKAALVKSKTFLRSKTLPTTSMEFNLDSKSEEEESSPTNRDENNFSTGVTTECELMSQEEYRQFVKEVKRGIHALTKIADIADKVFSWQFEDSSTVEIDFSINNELMNMYKEIVDSKVSDFMKAFIADLSEYIEKEDSFLKKQTELNIYDSNGTSLEEHPSVKFRSKKSSSLKKNLRRKSFQVPQLQREDTGRKVATIQQFPLQLSIPQLQEIADANENEEVNEEKSIDISSDSEEDGTPKVRNPQSGLLSINQDLTPSKRNLQEDGSDKVESDNIVKSFSSYVRKGAKKKSSRLIRVNIMKLTPQDNDAPTIKISYMPEARESEEGSMNSIDKLTTSKSAVHPKSATKSHARNKSRNLLKMCSMNESDGFNVPFPSLAQKVQFEEDEESPQKDVSPIGDIMPWESPFIRGYYSDSDKTTKRTRASSPDDQSKIQIDEFEFVKFLGKGAYGTVWLVKKKATNDLFAMKIVDWENRFTRNRIQSLKAERDIYEILQGDFVVKAVWTFHYENFICFVTEYMIGGDFNTILEDAGRLDEEQSRYYFAQLVIAIESLHKLGIVHRDLKPDNILMDQKGHMRLADFGLSENGLNKYRPSRNTAKKNNGGIFQESNILEVLEDEKEKEMIEEKWQRSKDRRISSKIGFRLKSKADKKSQAIFTFHNEDDQHIAEHNQRMAAQNLAPKVEESKPSKIGTPDYMAPEAIDPDLVQGKSYNQKCMDWWSMGVILYQFMIGMPPFCDESIDNVFDNILNRRIEWPSIGDDEDCISAKAADLIGKLLNPDPSKRLGVNGADEVKNHPFFEGIDWAGLNQKNGPIVPSVKDIKAEVNRLAQEKKTLPFADLGLKTGIKTKRAYDLKGFQLRRLDVLDKLNQDAYLKLKQKKSLNH